MGSETERRLGNSPIYFVDIALIDNKMFSPHLVYLLASSAEDILGGQQSFDDG